MNITQYIDKLEYLNATAEQIIKDFDLYEMEIKFSGNTVNAYSELMYQIVPHINNLIDKDLKKLLDVLYRIDVPEGKIKDCLEGNTSLSTSEAISDLIIKRELQKIVIRRHYKPDGYDE